MKMNKRKKTELGVTALAGLLVISSFVVPGFAGGQEEVEDTYGQEGESQKTEKEEEAVGKTEVSREGKDDETNGLRKSETVYVIADAKGRAEEIIVGEWLENMGGLDSLKDRSDLANIENVEGEETFSQDGENIIWDAKGNDIHYQGTSDKELPVSMQITYFLDGKEISPEKLAGQSGRVTIRYDYTNRETRRDEEGETIYVPFTVMSGMIFTDNCVKNVSVNSGKVITKDDKTVVVGVAFPGLQESLETAKKEESELDIELDIPDNVEVTFDAENFEMETSASLIMSDMFSDLDLDSEDGRQDLKEAIEELSDGAQELVDGSNDLADGVGELQDKLPDLIDGVQSLQDGIIEYTDGVSSVSSGVGELKSGSSQLASGAKELSSGAGDLADGAGTLADGAKSLASGMKDMKNGASGAKSGTEQLLNGYSGENGAVAGAKSLAAGAKQLDSGMDALSSGAEALIGGAGTLVSGISDINEGAASLDKGAEALQEGAAFLSQGTAQMTDSSKKLVTGIENVSQALSQLQIMLEGDQESQTAGQAEQLKTALAQISSVVGSDVQGDNSIHNCYDRISKDVNILYNFYAENSSAQGQASQLQLSGENENGDIDDAGIAALKESAVSSKTAAAGAAQQAASSSVSAKESLVSAENSRASAAAESASADGLYQNALSAYTPLLSNIKGTLNEVGLSQYAGYVDDGQGTAAAVAGSYQSASENYEAAAGSYGSAAAIYQESADSYQAAVESYEKTIADYEAIISQYEQMLAGQTVPVDSSENMTEGTTISEQQVQDIQAVWQDLFTNLQILAIIEGGDGGQNQGLTVSLETLEASLFGTGEDGDDGAFGEMTKAISQLYAGVGSLETTDTNTLLGGARALNAGSDQLMAGVSSLSGGIDELKAGTSTLAEGTAQLSAGASSLAEGADGFAAGVKSAKSGSSQLAGGAAQLSLGIEQLYSGTKELDGGLEALVSGADSLNSGAKSLSSGAKELAGGADTLASGADSLVSGTNTLDSGVSALQSGVSELSSNSQKLIDGAGELSDGTDELSDGVEELKDGADELKDGMEEFNEEGVKKLKQIFVDDMDQIIERLQAIQDAGNDYQSFAGIEDEMSGEVKFIIKTEGIITE